MEDYPRKENEIMPKKLTVRFLFVLSLFYCFIIFFACSTTVRQTTMVNPEALSEFEYNHTDTAILSTPVSKFSSHLTTPGVVKPRVAIIEHNSMDHLKKAFGLIAKHEKFKPKKYWSLEKKYLIGYGFQYKEYKTDYMNKQTADRILMKKIKEYDVYIDKLIKVSLTTNERAALISFMYNVGVTKFHKSTLLKYVNKDRMWLASNEFGRWIRCNGKKMTGLKIRRYEERNLFLS